MVPPGESEPGKVHSAKSTKEMFVQLNKIWPSTSGSSVRSLVKGCGSLCGLPEVPTSTETASSSSSRPFAKLHDPSAQPDLSAPPSVQEWTHQARASLQTPVFFQTTISWVTKINVMLSPLITLW